MEVCTTFSRGAVYLGRANADNTTPRGWWGQVVIWVTEAGNYRALSSSLAVLSLGSVTKFRFCHFSSPAFRIHLTLRSSWKCLFRLFRNTRAVFRNTHRGTAESAGSLSVVRGLLERGCCVPCMSVQPRLSVSAHRHLSEE